MRKMASGISKFLLPVIFAGYIGALSFYVHVHMVDGEAVVHSHPFRNLPGQPFHNHTFADFWLVHHATSYSVTSNVVPYFDWEARWTEVYTIVCCRTVDCFPLVVSGVLFLRAPPVVA